MAPKTKQPVETSRNNSSKEVDILSTLHPFEQLGICGTLSPVQKAITCAIKIHKGWANEDQILEFLIKNWDFITANTTHRYRQGPDKRMLHINFSITKDKQPLFIPHPTIPGNWGLPKVEAEKIETLELEQEKVIEAPKSEPILDIIPLNFEETLLSLLEKSSHGYTIQELSVLMHQYKDLPGLFPSLALDRRIRAVLIVFKNQNKIIYNTNNDMWQVKTNDMEEQIKYQYIVPRSKPSKDESIRSLTISELWERINSINS